ncbi:MAG: hypothetical protein BJG00_016215 [Limnothrix sp. CACIAM 69d]|nr:MAG: hypothetical protein BJG00_016215 [Limnothrix sp. CACIAM 69d]
MVTQSVQNFEEIEPIHYIGRLDTVSPDITSPKVTEPDVAGADVAGADITGRELARYPKAQ